MILPYTHPLLKGKPCLVHQYFVPSMDLFCRYLEICKLEAHVNSSHRTNTNVSGAIVKPAKVSNHLVGCAIDVNIIEDGKMLSSAVMTKPTNRFLQFVGLVRRSDILRWGGDFSPDENGKTDPVHFDIAINIRNRKKYDEIINELYKKPLTI